MRKINVILTTILAVSTLDFGAEAQTIPSWIRQNTIVAYDTASAALSDGVPVSGQSLTGVEQITVATVSATAVAGTVQSTFPEFVETNQFSCNAFGACTGFPAQFWVDPADPTHSKFGPEGQPLTIIGTAPLTVAGVTWTAVTMAYTNAASGVQFVTIFDVNSGLILEYSEHYPSEEVILTLRGLAGATLPTTTPAPNPMGPTAATSLVSSVLPSSRSVEVGATATAFASIVNAGGNPGTSCGLAPGSTVPATFGFQTTDPATNAVTGAANTLVDIPAGGTQSFVFSFKPNAAFAPTDIAITASCANSPAAPVSAGLNTLLLSASTTPVPDIVALAATAQNDGILHITGTSGSNAFAVATVNVGASASITATANTGTASLPLTINLCQTNPQTGQCMSTIGPSVTFAINANATPTVAIFATASGGVPFLPATNRIFVEFSDANEIVRGSTSVAVETQ
jgi:hypothetical protein